MKKSMHFGIFLFSVFVLGCLYLYLDKTKSVRYVVDNGQGQMYEQVWEKKGSRISFSSPEGTQIGSLIFGNRENLYFEKHQVIGVSSLYFFEKAPEEVVKNVPVTGFGEVVGEGDDRFLYKVRSEMIHAVREIDGRTVSVTHTINQNGVKRNIVKLYDNKNSDYYLPDEIIDRIIIGDEVISEFHFVAKGRYFFPLEGKSGVML